MFLAPLLSKWLLFLCPFFSLFFILVLLSVDIFEQFIFALYVYIFYIHTSMNMCISMVYICEQYKIKMRRKNEGKEKLTLFFCLFWRGYKTVFVHFFLTFQLWEKDSFSWKFDLDHVLFVVCLFFFLPSASLPKIC